MVRVSCIVLAGLLWMNSAQAAHWTKPDATPEQIARDQKQCTRQAAEKVPPDMAPQYPQPMAGGNQLMARRPQPGSGSGPAPVTDFNKSARDRYFRKCMEAKGYKS